MAYHAAAYNTKVSNHLQKLNFTCIILAYLHQIGVRGSPNQPFSAEKHWTRHIFIQFRKLWHGYRASWSHTPMAWWRLWSVFKLHPLSHLCGCQMGIAHRGNCTKKGPKIQLYCWDLGVIWLEIFELSEWIECLPTDIAVVLLWYLYSTTH